MVWGAAIKIIKFFNVILGDYSPELQVLGGDKNDQDSGLRWFRTSKSFPTLDNFTGFDMGTIKEQTTIFHEDEDTYIVKTNHKQGREEVN